MSSSFKHDFVSSLPAHRYSFQLVALLISAVLCATSQRYALRSMFNLPYKFMGV